MYTDKFTVFKHMYMDDAVLLCINNLEKKKDNCIRLVYI